MRNKLFRKLFLFSAIVVLGGSAEFASAADTFAPTILSIKRHSPSAAETSEETVLWRVTFSEDVRGVHKEDFALSGTAATPSEIVSVKEISQSVYDVTAKATDGTLGLVVRTKIDDIADLAGNAYDDAVASAEAYTVKRPPKITVSAATLEDTIPIKDTTITVVDDTAVAVTGVTIDPASTVGAKNFSCKQENSAKVICSLEIDSGGKLVVRAVDAAGNAATAEKSGYLIRSEVSVDKPKLKIKNSSRKFSLSKRKRVIVNKKTLTVYGEVPELKGGQVKIYADRRKKKKLGTAKIDEKTGRWSKTLKFSKDGKYKLYFRFYDRHGNKMDTRSGLKLRVDTQPPEFVDLPEKLRKRPGERLWWQAQDNDKIKRYRYQWRGRKIKTKKSHFFIPKNTPPGTYILIVRAYDRAGGKTDKKVTVTVR